MPHHRPRACRAGKPRSDRHAAPAATIRPSGSARSSWWPRSRYPPPATAASRSSTTAMPGNVGRKASAPSRIRFHTVNDGIRKRRAIGLAQRLRHRPRADDQDLARCSCAPASAPPADCRQRSSTSSPDGNPRPLPACHPHPNNSVTPPLTLALPAALLPGKIVADLHRDPQPVNPGRPGQHSIVAAIQERILDLGARQQNARPPTHRSAPASPAVPDLRQRE